MIYNDLLTDLVHLCEELDVDVHNINPISFSQFCRVETPKELARRYGVTESTIYQWRKRFGIVQPSANAIDYDKMDVLLRQGLKVKEVMAEMGCSKYPVICRRKELGLSNPQPKKAPQAPSETPAESYLPVKTREELFNRWVRIKGRALGRPIQWMIETWRAEQKFREIYGS